jgi:gamma-glutamylcyclotransferase (GGCT)/AIG2-like uncharacterized protein YtfP
MVKVFVYGTLKRGDTREGAMSAYGGKFLREATLPRHTLYNVGAFPAAVPSQDDHHVIGELFEIPPKSVTYLDSIEGHPFLYKRTTVTLDDGTEASCYIWQRPIIGMDHLGEKW